MKIRKIPFYINSALYCLKSGYFITIPNGKLINFCIFGLHFRTLIPGKIKHK